MKKAKGCGCSQRKARGLERRSRSHYAARNGRARKSQRRSFRGRVTVRVPWGWFEFEHPRQVFMISVMLVLLAALEIAVRAWKVA